MEDEIHKYISTLKIENENLREEIKVISDDRDQSKYALQNILSKYIELVAEKEGKEKEEILNEIRENFKNILNKRD